MYQTVGHAHVAAIAQSMDLPLFRRGIDGTAVEQGLRYPTSGSPGDEVEDLLELLKQVQAAIPNVDAVCSGAILSNYQRARVESVCARLGLVSLAYLWQRDQHALLAEMVAAGVEAVLVKVASLGLKQSDLGRTIGELAGRFEGLHRRFGFHECGEGGEYETFTLDCPLFKKRLQPVGEERVVAHGADVSLLIWERLELVEKAEKGALNTEGGSTGEGGEDEVFKEDGDSREERGGAKEEGGGAKAAVEPGATWLVAPERSVEGLTVGSLSLEGVPVEGYRPVEGWATSSLGQCGALHLSYTEHTQQRLDAARMGVAAEAAEVPREDALRAALERLPLALSACGLTLDHLLYVRLYVPSMANYKALNAIYSDIMEQANPPPPPPLPPLQAPSKPHLSPIYPPPPPPYP